jgi:hypothetical protein
MCIVSSQISVYTLKNWGDITRHLRDTEAFSQFTLMAVKCCRPIIGCFEFLPQIDISMCG